MFIRDRNITINTIITSGAERARTTAQLVAERISFSPDNILVEDDLYSGSLGTYLNVIRHTDNHHHLLLVGHNPTISYLVEYLTQSASGDFAPGDLRVLSLDIGSWKDLDRGKAKITETFSPSGGS